MPDHHGIPVEIVETTDPRLVGQVRRVRGSYVRYALPGSTQVPCAECPARLCENEGGVGADRRDAGLQNNAEGKDNA